MGNGPLFGARKLIRSSGELLALTAAAFMCLAAFHGAAHDHDDEHEDAPDCFAFHFVAETPAAPPADLTSDIAPDGVFTERLRQEAVILSASSTERRRLPRGPPLQTFAS